MRRKKPLPELPRIYVKPELERREREASRAWFVATCSGDRNRPAPDTVDPLWMRLGLRANLIKQRAGWVVSSPILSDSLDRNPLEDPSLPGPGWLREVYRWRDGRSLCLLPRTRAAIEERRRPLREAEERAQQATREPAPSLTQARQLELLL
jgi:hypothetical protein